MVRKTKIKGFTISTGCLQSTAYPDPEGKLACEPHEASNLYVSPKVQRIISTIKHFRKDIYWHYYPWELLIFIE